MNLGPLFSTFYVEQPETLIEWKFESITDGPTDGLTWVGARDTCLSKNMTEPIQKFRLELKFKPDNGNQFIGKLQAGGVQVAGRRTSAKANVKM